jgi:polar amino acid transport system substrate-binding protein
MGKGRSDMRKVVVICSVIVFMIAVSPLMAASLRMGTYPIPKMVESEDRGVFIDLAREVAKRAGYVLDLEIAPPPRIVGDFSQGKFDGFFPALDVLLVFGAAAKSSPVYTKQDFAFFRKEGAELRTIEDLEGKRVGITRGYPYAAELMSNRKILFDSADDDVTNMKKLASGRIDAFVVEERNGLEALKKSGGVSVTYDATKPISRQAVYFAFKSTPEGKSAAEAFSRALGEMKKDGSLAKILSRAN